LSNGAEIGRRTNRSQRPSTIIDKQLSNERLATDAVYQRATNRSANGVNTKGNLNITGQNVVPEVDSHVGQSRRGEGQSNNSS